MNASTAPTVGTNANYDYGNQDPNDVMTDEVINAAFIIDVSISIDEYVDELNTAYNGLKNELAGSHVGPKLFVSMTQFNDKIVSRGGFQPIQSLPDIDFRQHLGGNTALYDATLDGLTNAMNYRTSLEASGINVKTLIFIITDGADNSSRSDSAGKVSDIIKDISKQELSHGSFTSILFGIGNDRPTFEKAHAQMGIEHLGVITNSAKDIRAMISFISQSISNSSAGVQTSSPNF
jgi:uncharacterized protein YegL